MTSNRKRKGKGVVGESSSSAQVDKSRFWDENAEANYAMLMNKSMPRERGFDLEYMSRPLIAQAVRNHWGEFIKTPTDAVIPIVREFYANLRVRHEDLKVKVRGKKVPFESKRINALYNLPNIANDGYRTFRQSPIEYDEFIDYLCYPGTVWKLNAHRQVTNFPSRSLKQAASAVFLFVIARMMPAKHSTDVTKDRAILIYCILKGYTVDVGKVIEESILTAAGKTRNISLPHSSLITELCQSAGVLWTEDEDVLKVQVPVKVPTRQTMDNDDRPVARPSGSTSQQPDMPPRQPTMNQRLVTLEQRMESLYMNTANFMAYQVEFNTALGHRFPDPNQLYPPFPAPPEWKDDDEEEDVEEEDAEDDDDDEH